MDQQLLREFLADAEDLIGLLNGDVEALRAARKGRERRALIASIFRHAHTLKGAAATVELETLVRIAHELESLLDSIRLGHVRLSEAVLAAFDEASHALAETLNAAARGEACAPPSALVERLRALAQTSDREAGTSPEASLRILASLPPALAHSLSTREVERLREAAEEGSRLFFINFNLDLATFDQQYRALENALSSEGEIINTLPGMADAPPGTLGFQLLYATEESAARVAARVEPFTAATLEEIVLDALKEPDRFQDQFSESERQAQSASLLGSRHAPAQTIQTMMRVELEELDEAIHAAHELCKRSSVVLERALASGGGRIGLGESLDDLASDVRSRAFKLAEKLIALRVAPADHILTRQGD
jgi:chemotaxis protein histidine kinase CheA